MKPLTSTAGPSSDSPASPAPSKTGNPKSKIAAYRLLLTLAAGILILDQLTKFWITRHVPFNPGHVHDGWRDIAVIRGFFYIIHVGNTGAAWSMFSGRSVVLGLFSAATLFAIFHWRHALGLKHRFTQVCFGLLCGGIAGNGIDRIAYKHVIDFIDLHFGTYVYPTFNVADSGICIGVMLYLWHSLREK